MKAIQDGKPADHIKKYTEFASSVTTHGGTIDVVALSQPDGPIIDTSKPVEAQLKPEPVTPVSTPVQPVSTTITTPTMSPTAVVNPAPVIQPLTIPKAVKQAQWTGVTTPPDSAMNECPPNVVSSVHPKLNHPGI